MGNLSGKSYAFVAVDSGPRRTLEVVAGFASSVWSEVMDWDPVRSDNNLLIVGTSTSRQGSSTERHARQIAVEAGIPVVCIEDSPGNYRDYPELPTQLLIVESAYSIEIYQGQLVTLPEIICIPNVRYDPLRSKTKSCTQSNVPYQILWAGQPETLVCLDTLTWLLSAFQGVPIDILFRAHPRDQGYQKGDYDDLFRRNDIQDVTDAPLDDILMQDIRLVVSHFSSVSVEAGFYGIPALYVLFEDAGGVLAIERMGCALPPLCRAGAAFIIVDRRQTDILHRALSSDPDRKLVLERFNAFYSVSQFSLPLVRQALQRIIINT